jgi:hypothetical protein
VIQAFGEDMEFEFQGIQVSNKHNDLPAVIAKRALAGIDGKYPYSLVDFEVTLKVRRSQNNNDRLFRQILLTIRLPEFEKLWERKITLEIDQGEKTGEAKYICGALPLDFVEPKDAHLELVFSDGDEFVGSTVVPVTFKS